MTFSHLDSVIGLFIKRAQALGNTEPWVVKALLHASQIPELFDLSQSLEGLLAALSENQFKEVEARFSRIIPSSSGQWHEEYDEQFREVLVELLGWKWLQERYRDNSVGFYPRSTKTGVRTPDLGVWDGDNLLAATECKKVNVSQEEKAWLQAEPMTLKSKSGTVNVASSLDPSSPLAKKLVATIQVATCQLESTHLPDNKSIFMSISLDTPIWTDPIKLSVQQFLQEQADTLRPQGVEFLAFERYQTDRPLI